MTAIRRDTAWGTMIRVPIPKVRDPFVNTNLLAVGPGDDGVERFWISTWNENAGCQGALVTEDGRCRRYRFPGHGGFYSAAPEDADTLWLCGTLSHVVRLSLRTGRYEVFATDLPWTLVFQGMVFDPATGTLFAAAFSQRAMATVAIAFDTRGRRLSVVHEIPCPDRYMRQSFPNGDGTYAIVLHCPGETLLHWDPRAETVDVQVYKQTLDVQAMHAGTTYHLMADEAGRRYFPDLGWFTPATRTFADGPRPAREMTWFARRGRQAWGASFVKGSLTIGRWHFDDGAVEPLCAIPDAQLHNVALTGAGKVLAVNQCGELFRFDGETGALELSRRLPVEGRGYMNCLRRLDDDRVLGTPYITQRFWEVNLRTGAGRECGRAAPGTGEVLQTWRIGGKVYMAAYTGAELVEYDPARHPHFPENPRVVADPPQGMRPVAAADDGRRLYYACSLEYGRLGTMLVQYDTRTGEARYGLNPLGNQQIWSLWYHRPSHGLLCATTMHADARSCLPTDDRCWFAVLDADTLQPRMRTLAPPGVEGARVLGPLDRDRYLAACDFPDGRRLFTLDLADLAVPDAAAMRMPPRGCRQIVPTARPGRFVLHIARRLELWDLNRWQRLRVVYDRYHRGRGYHVDGDSLYVLTPRDLIVLDGVLA